VRGQRSDDRRQKTENRWEGGRKGFAEKTKKQFPNPRPVPIHYDQKISSGMIVGIWAIPSG
jgi:hypothetical protein